MTSMIVIGHVFDIKDDSDVVVNKKSNNHIDEMKLQV
jgi:hypothetical protein